jgi:hypothetical protein
VSETETNSGEAESDGKQESKRKKRAPWPRPQLALGVMGFLFCAFFWIRHHHPGGITEQIFMNLRLIVTILVLGRIILPRCAAAAEQLVVSILYS